MSNGPRTVISIHLFMKTRKKNSTPGLHVSLFKRQRITLFRRPGETPAVMDSLGQLVWRSGDLSTCEVLKTTETKIRARWRETYVVGDVNLRLNKLPGP